MSLVTLSSIGIARDVGEPPRRSGLAASGTRGGAPLGSYGQLVVAQIPSEAVLAYTTVLAVFAAGGSDYRVGRWVLYAAIVALCPIVVITSYLAKRDYLFIDPAPVKAAPVMVLNPLDITDASGAAPEISTAEPTRERAPLHLPILPAAAATATMAVFGLAVPGSALQYELSGVGFGIIAVCLAAAGGVLMSILAPFLGKPNSARIDPGTTA